MKTMPGGWGEVNQWSAARDGAADAAEPVSVLRCVQVNASRRAQQSALEGYAPLPALKRTLLASAAPENRAPQRPGAAVEPFRQLARHQPPPLPERWQTPGRRAPLTRGDAAAARSARIALDATCELHESDLVVFSAPAAARGRLGRGATLMDLPIAHQRFSRRTRFVRWLRRWLGAARADD